MEHMYLPGTIRDRITDLMKEHKISQTDLAVRIGTTDSTISRFLTGKTDKLSDENIIRIARAFNVSTDFLLGVSNIPDRKNFEIAELGLSVQAARNLYTGKVSPDVVNRLLESPRFAEVTYMLEQYFDDTLAEGFAGQNQLYATLSAMLRNKVKTDAAVQAAQTVNRMRVPAYQADLTFIQNQFMTAIREVKKEIGSDFTAIQAMNKEVAEKIFTELTKGQDVQHPTATPEQIADAITRSVAGIEGVHQQALDKLGSALVEFMNSTLQQVTEQEKDDAGKG